MNRKTKALPARNLNPITPDRSTGIARLLYRVDAVAELASVSVRTVQRCIASGDLEAVRIGRATRVTAASVEALIARRGTR